MAFKIRDLVNALPDKSTDLAAGKLGKVKTDGSPNLDDPQKTMTLAQEWPSDSRRTLLVLRTEQEK
ncbi:MAG: hypothetical protein ABI217_10195 [Chthoniobacterales bacterium]